MIYTITAGQSFDPEILRQELVAAIGETGWYINTSGNQVEFIGDGFDPSAIILAHFNNGMARAKAKVWGLIKIERDKRKLEGGYSVGANWFHSDTFSRTQQIGLTMMGASIPAGLMWKTMDGTFVEMTQTLAMQVFQAGAAKDMETFAAAEAHKAAMEISETPSEYDFSGGWPTVYGG